MNTLNTNSATVGMISSKCDDEKFLMCSIKCATIKFQKDIDKFSLSLDELRDFFHFHVGRLVDISPLYLYLNPLTEFIKRNVGNHIPTYFLEEIQHYEDDPIFKSRLREVLEMYDTKIETDSDIDIEEFQKILAASKLFPAKQKKYLNYLLKMILEKRVTLDKNTYLNFLESYIEAFIKENALNVYFKFGPIKFKRNYTLYARAVQKFAYYFITFNIELFCPDDVIGNIENIMHEIWHTIQDDTRYSKIEHIILFKKDDLIRTALGEGYYDENYDVCSYEADANLKAARMMLKILRSLSRESYLKYGKSYFAKIKNSHEALQNLTRTYNGKVYTVDELYLVALKRMNKKDEIDAHFTRQSDAKRISLKI